MNFSLNRIILFVQDVELLKNFYQQHFGWRFIEETANEWAVLQAGNCELALHKIGVDAMTIPKDRPSFTNTKLVFETEADLKVLCQKLLGDGMAMGEVKSFEGYPHLFCDGTDPEGNVFQLMGKADA